MPAIRLEPSCSAFRPGWPCRRAMRRLSPPLRIMRGPNYRRWRGRALEPDYLGTCFGRLPVVTYADPVYVDCLLGAGARFHCRRKSKSALYQSSPESSKSASNASPRHLAVFTLKAEVVLATDVATHFILIGGPKLDGPRIVWWNFVSSSQERIEAAKADWRAGRFAPVPGDHEFIPLPE